MNRGAHGAPKVFRCESLWTDAGWVDDARIEVDACGTVTRLIPKLESAASEAEDLGGYVIPGFINAHSHAFQYAMGGLAEHLPAGAASDDFWSWRDTMYRLANDVSPDRMEAVATMLYAEMLRHGYTSVVEFHYLHHDHGGVHYENRAEMSARLIAAAQSAGIRLTLVPVLYQRGGFNRPATPQQQRFLSVTLDDYRRLLADAANAGRGVEDVVIGRGVHSLRAAKEEDVKALLRESFHGPFHLHIAEQRKEVDDCLAQWRKRPVAWLLDETPVDRRMNLVHATHIDADETTRLAKSGATVVICPSTEGNLGDGFFPLQDYVARKGAFTIGTDSHIGLSPMEELRWLDYGQRLRSERRNPLCNAAGDDSAEILARAVWKGGLSALGDEETPTFAPKTPFDAVVLDSSHPIFWDKEPARRLAAFIHGGDATAIRTVLRRGKVVVTEGRHVRRDAIVASYRRK